MRFPPAVIKFFVKLILFYALSLGAWPFIGGAYGAAFRAVYSQFFRTMFPEWKMAMGAKSDPTTMWDSELILHNPKTRQTGVQPFGSRYHGYAATSMLLSLVLASPLAWGRLGRALFWGLILVHFWIAFALWLFIVNGYSGDNPLAIYSFSPTVKRIVSFAAFLATESTTPRYLVPVFLWMIVAFRKGDWEGIVKTPVRDR